MIPLLWMGVALAQDVPLLDPATIDVPELNTQLFRPTVDGPRTLWVDDSHVPDGWTWGTRLLLDYVHAPFVVRTSRDERVDLVGSATALELVASIGYEAIRIGVDVPVYVGSTSDVDPGGAGLGDIGIDIKGELLDRTRTTVGFALAARMWLPTSTVDAALGSSDFVGEVGLILDGEVGPVLLTANLGTRFAPETVLADVTLNDMLTWRAAAAWEVAPEGGIAAELAGHSNYAAPGAVAGVPLELLISGWGRMPSGLTLRGGLGKGLTDGIGAPTWRGLLAVGFEPVAEPARDLDGDGLVGRFDACPEDPEDLDGWQDEDGCPEDDNDGDGLIDRLDACPDEAEDLDGWLDMDGCADADVHLTVRVLDPDDKPMMAHVDLGGPAGSVSSWEGQTGRVHPGRYDATVRAEGFDPASVALDVGEEDLEVDVILTPAAQLARLRIDVAGPAGELVAARVQIGEDWFDTVDGQVSLELGAGTWPLHVEADGHSAADLSVELEEGAAEVVLVRLEQPTASLDGERIQLRGKIYFETNRDRILHRSLPLLNDVATVMREHPEVQLLRIEGHTDARGRSSYNLGLSRERAKAVRAYLIRRGIDPDRLRSVGYGESRPVDRSTTPSAWAKNRRVDFYVERWAEQ